MHAAVLGLPYFHLGSIGFIQSFGAIVALGVLIGAEILRRYGEWHGVDDEDIRKLLGWVTICGFLGAHEFDILAYPNTHPDVLSAPPSWWFLGADLWPTHWPLPLRLWEGISSYGGFIGGALGFFFYVWWKRKPMRLFADMTIVGLLPAFSIGRIGCTVVSDHVGAAVDPSAWYSFLAMDYPRDLNMDTVQALVHSHPGTGPITAWNLGLIEFLYLVPVNILVLWLAFRPSKRLAAGFIPVFTGVLYAPVRFFLDFLRPDDTDPRYFGLTFAQWASILFFAAAAYTAMRILKTGKPAETVAPTAGEAHRKLQVILKEAEEETKHVKDDKKKDEKKDDKKKDDKDDD